MKKLLLVCSLVAAFGLAAQAQSCSKAKAAAKSETSVCASTLSKAVAADASVEQRTCAKSGKVSYVRKSVCPASGKVSYSNVEYCSKSKKFVNVSPSKQSCTKGKGQATKVSNSSAKSKASCAKKCTAAQKAACGAAGVKQAKAKQAPAEGAKVKLVKSEQ